MKITLKTLKQQTFFVEVDVEQDTVRTLKEKLHAESGLAYPVDRQRLIYLGKIMEDDHLLSQYKLDDKKFIVVMSKKPPADEPAPEQKESGDGKPADKDTAAGRGEGTGEPATSASKPSTGSAVTATASSTATPSPAPAAAAGAPSTASDQKTAAAASPAADSSNPTNPSTDAVPEEMRINIQRLTEMGYPEQSARLALEICANIPDRAVEYLLSEMGGGSDMSFALTAAAQLQQQQQQQQGQGAGIDGAAVAQSGDANPLAFLRDNPVFEDMRRILRDDPSMLPYLMRRMQASNPDLLNIIAEYQDEFLALINEGSNAGGQPAGQPMSRELESIAAAMVNSLTPSDMDAIERLKALGYPEHLVIQAYIACERDEYDAAMFLVTQTLDEEE
ncbi:UV excision repair protein RAD23 homolog B [Anopheles gambiae]|uniref:UV excision repair protein RAD23 homolog B n=1 Tax=Anopheles gambiae TaxID=7165 RepID=UPI002AC9291E|nr:UV excision repair protein RAD23 homolog B [Anopheles gambiae]